MEKRFLSAFLAVVMSVSLFGCSLKKNAEETNTETESVSEIVTEADLSQSEEEEAETLQSPMESITISTGKQVSVQQAITLRRETDPKDGRNYHKLKVSDLIQDGDYITSLTFVIRSLDNSPLGQVQYGCGISVDNECPLKTEPYYFEAKMECYLENSYEELTYDVPPEVAEYIQSDGEIMFGYWWGDYMSIELEYVICSFNRTKSVPNNGTVTKEVNEEATGTGYTFKIDNDFLPVGKVPQVVKFKLSSEERIYKFNGSFGFESLIDKYTGDDIAVWCRDSNTLEISWFVPIEVRSYIANKGTYLLDYGWSEPLKIKLDSISVIYSDEGERYRTETIFDDGFPEEQVQDPSNTSFRTAQEIVDDIKVGWNLGNTLECYNTDLEGIETETGWGNPKTTLEMIKSVKGAGFNAIRIPVTWAEHMDGDVIQSEWLGRVQEVVDYAYNEKMYVILNMHHDDYIWFEPSDSDVERNNNSIKLRAIWTQIANHFIDYGDRLLFEGMNEPRTIGSAMEWRGGTTQERTVINNYEKEFINAVRETGGNNSERTLIYTSYAASAETVALDAVNVPQNGNVIFSVHYYAPWKFAEGTETEFTEEGKQELAEKFKELKEKFIDQKGIPVIIDEFGCGTTSTDEVRQEYYRYYITTAREYGIKCFVWDNGLTDGKDGFGILSRKDNNWNNTLLLGIMS